MNLSRNSMMTVVVAAFVLLAGLAFAPQADNAKLRGDSYYFSTGQMYDLHAFQHARMLHKFAAAGETVPRDVLKEHITAIRSNVAAAEKSFARLSDATKKNPDIAKKLAEVGQYNKKILELCKTLDAAAVKEQVASDAILPHSTGIKQHITAAYGSSRDAADGGDIFTEEWDKPGHGAFSD